jgi:type VI secretion system protein VasG
LLDEALEAAVRLSHRYIPARQLPDKAVSLLDTVCARVAISQHAVPPQLEDCRRTIEGLQVELGIIGREEAVGVDTARRRRECEEKLAAAESRRVELEQRWEAEHKLADRLLEIRAALRQAADQDASPACAVAGTEDTIGSCRSARTAADRGTSGTPDSRGTGTRDTRPSP